MSEQPAFPVEVVRFYIDAASPKNSFEADVLNDARAFLQISQEAAIGGGDSRWEPSEEHSHYLHLFDSRQTPLVFRWLPAPAEGNKAKNLTFLVAREIYTALCQKSAKYKAEVSQINTSVGVIIGGIAATVAGEFNVAVAVVSALVAALLRLVLKMGVAVYCERFGELFKEQEPAKATTTKKRPSRPETA